MIRENDNISNSHSTFGRLSFWPLLYTANLSNNELRSFNLQVVEGENGLQQRVLGSFERTEFGFFWNVSFFEYFEVAALGPLESVHFRYIMSLILLRKNH